MYYLSEDGRRILDATSGLWCMNCGHAPRRIVEAVRRQLEELDYAPAFQFSHPKAFLLADRLIAMFPWMSRVFFCNSGAEAVDSALKIALAWHRLRGLESRTILIGRERGYHGAGFGGISVGGIASNRSFGALLPHTAHLPHTLDLERNRFARGQPEWGAVRADALEDLVSEHGADKIAAVIVEPMAGSTGVLPPPVGYLERLREICDRHGLVLIFDEVITAFGRLGSSCASALLGVEPDIMTCAKALSGGVVPIGAVLVKEEIYRSFAEEERGDHEISFFHGYTYSGNPVAVSAGLAALDVYAEEDLFARASHLGRVLETAVHGLREAAHVRDIRNFGLAAAIDLESRADAPGARGYAVMCKAFEAGLMVRVTGDVLSLSPPLIASPGHVHDAVDILRRVLRFVP